MIGGNRGQAPISGTRSCHLKQTRKSVPVPDFLGGDYAQQIQPAWIRDGLGRDARAVRDGLGRHGAGSGADTRNLMLDFGYTPRALLNNMEVMGVDGAKTQALIVSHGHFDHFGGLVGYLQKFRGRLPADLTLYPGGEDNFCARKTGTGVPGHFTDWGVLDRRDLEKLNVRIVKCEKPTLIQGHAFTTGNIARRSFEKLPGGRVLYR